MPYSYGSRARYACNTLGGQLDADCDYGAFLDDTQAGVGMQTRARLLISTSADLQTKYTLHWQDCKWTGVKSLYKDGCGFGWYSTDSYEWSQNEPVVTDNPINKENRRDLGFTSYGRHVLGIIFRVNNVNKNAILKNVSLLTASQRDMINKNPAVVCVSITGYNSSTPYYLVGCVVDQINPGPPVFNDIAVSAMRGVVVVPSKDDTSKPHKSWYQSIGSTFDNVTAKVSYGGLSETSPITLKVTNLLNNSKSYGSCSAYDTFPSDLSKTRYYAMVAQDTPDRICVYYDKCPKDVNEATQYIVGCAPRPGMLENGMQYIPLVDYTTICDSGSAVPLSSRFSSFDILSGACKDASGNIVVGARPSRAISLAFVKENSIKFDNPIGTDIKDNQIILVQRSGNYYNIARQDDHNNTVVGDFLTLYKMTTTKKHNYLSNIKDLEKSTILMKFTMIQSDGPDKDTSTAVQLDGGQAAYKDIQISTDDAHTVTHKQYTQDNFFIAPISINSSCISADAKKSNCFYPAFAANVIIPDLSDNDIPSVVNARIVRTDSAPQNCTAYQSPLDADVDTGIITLYQPAGLSFRNTDYCFCDTQKCTAGDNSCCNQVTSDKSNCTCQLCDDKKTAEVAYAACHGEYGVAKLQASSLPEEKDIRRDNICFYFLNSWDFISGYHSDTDEFWGGAAGGDDKKQLYCAKLPGRCYNLNMPADWNGYGVWNADVMPALSGQTDVVGKCAPGYEASGRKITLNNTSACIAKDPAPTGCPVPDFGDKYKTASTKLDKITKDKVAAGDQVRIADLIGDSDIKAYLDAYSQCCSDGEGYVNTPPSDDRLPLADCVAGIFENFRNACIKQ